MLLVRLPVSSRPLVVILGSQNLYVCILLCGEIRAPTPALFKGQLYFEIALMSKVNVVLAFENNPA